MKAPIAQSTGRLPAKGHLVLAASLIVLLVLPSQLFAHVAEGDSAEHSIWTKWNFDWQLVLSVVAAVGFYAVGVRNLWKKVGHGRAISRRQIWTFGAGVLALIVALVSPLDALSAELSSAHMVQHMILMNVAAPLLIMSSPLLAFSWALAPKYRTKLGSIFRRMHEWRPRNYLVWQPILLWVVYGVTLWVWHLPALYQTALRNEFVHELQHISFFAVSCVFWRVLLDPLKRLHFGRGLAIVYLFTTSLHATLLGVFMALSPRVWYPDYETTVSAWSLSAIEDQQLAGLIMWMPACAVYAIVAAFLFASWLQESEYQQHAPEFE
ncbi:MAG: cytochrome c oxidase assembly protein [Verrucomicrobia bacterium]|nr:cytochrome c oxidase assembly protein [Verrucomicrobiota bacterium]